LKRLTIYAFYDPAGLVDAYVVDCVSAIAEYSERVLFISNGDVDADSVQPIANLANVEVVERVNEGLDIWGYKHGLDFVGWSELERYDEVVMMNSTIAGPLYPLSEMFDAMDASEVDFWGITAHGGEDYDPWHLLPTGRIERHIQSYFMAVRKRMLKSIEFRSYWDSLIPLISYTDAVARHEAVFTHTFSEFGFQWSTYVDGTDLEFLSSYPLMFLPELVLIGKRCPFFKRKALFLEADDLIATQAISTATMIHCLDRLGYDLQRVLPSVIRTSHQSDVRLALNTFELLECGSDEHVTDLSTVRVVAWVRDMANCFALERCRPTLEHCSELVIVTPCDSSNELTGRLSEFKARIISGATFAGFVREVGRVAHAPDHHLLLFGANGSPALDPLISAYVQSETGLRALAGTDSTLAAAVARLASSNLAGGLTSPLTGIAPASRMAAWRGVASRASRLLMTLGIDVPTDPEKPAWGPPSGVVLVGPGMLDTDWDLVAEIMGRLDDSDTGELFAAMIPFVIQSHGKVLAYALPESMTPNTTFIAHVQGGGVVKVQSRRRAQAARLYHRLERAGSKAQSQPSALRTLATATSVTLRKLRGMWRRHRRS
jgi:hypothetical protein